MVSIIGYSVIISSLLETESLDGDIVEMGCNEGRTSILLKMLSSKNLYVYDSFCGLPEKDIKDGNCSDFLKGSMSSSEERIVENFKSYNVSLPFIKKAWFSELSSSDIPSKISFCYLDGDFYDSIKTSLNLVYDKVVSGGIVLIDDYGHVDLPGVKLAVDEFLENKKNYKSVFIKTRPHQSIFKLIKL